MAKIEANLFSTAFKLHTIGYSVIPSGGGDKGKSPLVLWAEYRRRWGDTKYSTSGQRKPKLARGVVL